MLPVPLHGTNDAALNPQRPRKQRLHWQGLLLATDPDSTIWLSYWQDIERIQDFGLLLHLSDEGSVELRNPSPSLCVVL
jgi:hypothetical protein